MPPIRTLHLIDTLERGGAEQSLLEITARMDRTRFQPVVCAVYGGDALRPPFEAAARNGGSAGRWATSASSLARAFGRWLLVERFGKLCASASQQETGDRRMGQLTEELRQAVEAHRGFLEVGAGDSTYVVMSMSVFREMMGVGTDDEYQASLRAIEEGWADVQAGRTRPLDEFLRDFDRQHGIPS